MTGLSVVGAALVAAFAVGPTAEGPDRETWRAPEPTPLEQRMTKNRLAMASGGLLLSGGVVLATLTASPAIDGVIVAGNEERMEGLAIAGLTAGLAMGATGIVLLSHYGVRQSWRRAEYWDLLPPEQAWRSRDAYLRRTTLTGVGLFGAGLAAVGIVLALSANASLEGHAWGTLGGIGAATALSTGGLAVAIPSGIAWGKHRRDRGRFSLRGGVGGGSPAL